MKPHKIVPLNWVQWVSLTTSVAVAVLLPLLSLQARAQRSQANQGLRTFICFFQDAVLHPQGKPPPTGGQKLYVEHFFKHVLVAIHQPSCGGP